MLFVAMFLSHHAWLQVTIFVLCSLLMCLFISISWPFIKPTSNQLELFNEIMIMFVGILSMAYVGVVKGPTEGYQVGEIMSWIIIF